LYTFRSGRGILDLPYPKWAGCGMIAPNAGLDNRADSQPENAWSSCRLWSLWEMLNTYAWQFFLLRGFLDTLHRRFDVPLPQSLVPSSGLLSGLSALAPPSTGGIGNPLTIPSVAPLPNYDPIDESGRADANGTLELIERCCISIGMIRVSPDIERAVSEIKVTFDRKRIQFHIENITNRIIDELNHEEFLHVPPDRSQYYQKLNLFGDAVGPKISKGA
jgi:hypothetical protein